jgi:hypothetical protein
MALAQGALDVDSYPMTRGGRAALRLRDQR